ncbi:PREDICTED: 52 kDa repressor of the inhibitor of the protein kinase-like [Acropora digitifera]|uniref:52 kDa repressor of the inhibitor of the protein kinase-like n=1 Tax=Acropora digitifera TaxID=70779 RepID=UPI00077A8312|nr:PREDICTED: 52 kDa repressor of the inhibitor of the protein kinase-like [Acropora digitifera]
MPSFCCVPKCNQKGYSTSSGEKVSFLNFPKEPLIRKQWIHAIRRDEGKDFVITERTKVCSLHFRSEDLRKSINGRIYIKEGGVPSKFDWSGPSPKKRKAPTERQPLPAKKKLLTEDNVSVNNEVQETIEMSASEPSTSFKEDTCKTPGLEKQIAEQSTKIGELEEKLKQAESEINNLRHENTELN